MKNLITTFFFFLFIAFSITSFSTSSSSASYLQGSTGKPQGFASGEEKVGSWTKGLLQFSESPSPSYEHPPGDTLILAAKRTIRPDILSGFRRYRGGWDIRNRHYWASVGFTGSAGFILAALWFVCFGFALVVHHCCRWNLGMKHKVSESQHKICLILLLVLTCAAATGCILLSVGQDEFHGEVMHAMTYVVIQSDYVVQTLRNVTQYLSTAKNIKVDQLFLPSEVKDEIDKLNMDLSAAANTLAEKTSENSGRIKKLFNAVRSALISMAAVMLLLSLLGLLLSVLGHQHAIYIFIWSGWLLVAVTFLLLGVFIILNNAISDTCVAMDEWVENPNDETALSNILPCVDQVTTSKTLTQSKEVINQLVNIVNTAIWSFANWDPPPQDTFAYSNQSGPLMPPLCSPFDSQLHDRPCASEEVSFSNASLVWQNYTCTVSALGLCTSAGRITPNMYTQLVAAVDVSYALDHYTPPLLSLQDCNFVRDTFRNVTVKYCSPLEGFLRMVNAGLVLISIGTMMCLIFWILYANHPRREEVFVKKLSLPIIALCRLCNKDCNINSNNNTVPSTGVEV
ncbi:uncharacterized protein LOC113298379 [Papaver somniferum]|uniref:uncharacterized protein LOC113298379 n=1 Tax=Papaver somniferum TaxID=3469 RepID=UPI000E6FD711|nr:uncharacterized protein LOC113298379 [Papaver somniferum]